MNPETLKSEEPPRKKSADAAVQSQLSVVYFKEPVNFAGSERGSASVHLPNSAAASNAIESIQPALLLPNGDWRPIKDGEAATGLGLTARQNDLHTHKRVVVRSFVPTENVRCMGYRAE